VSPHETRVQRCSKADATKRLRHAIRFLEVAKLVTEEGDDLDYSSASASLAVLAGFAASDAACCAALGRRARGRDHQEAAMLVGKIEPGGKKAATSLRRLLGLKDEAQYGFFDVGGQQLKSALRQADDLVGFANGILRR
jgi:hypothetical protein